MSSYKGKLVYKCFTCTSYIKYYVTLMNCGIDVTHEMNVFLGKFFKVCVV